MVVGVYVKLNSSNSVSQNEAEFARQQQEAELVSQFEQVRKEYLNELAILREVYGMKLDKLLDSIANLRNASSKCK